MGEKFGYCDDCIKSKLIRDTEVAYAKFYGGQSVDQKLEKIIRLLRVLPVAIRKGRSIDD